LVGLHPIIINDVAQEAGSCLMCLEQEEFPIPDGGGLLRTTTVVERKISPSFQAKHVHYHNWYKNVLNISACFG
jgi:Fe-S cluster assembly scaffold protein SufB